MDKERSGEGMSLVQGLHTTGNHVAACSCAPSVRRSMPAPIPRRYSRIKQTAGSAVRPDVRRRRGGDA